MLTEYLRRTVKLMVHFLATRENVGNESTSNSQQNDKSSMITFAIGRTSLVSGLKHETKNLSLKTAHIDLSFMNALSPIAFLNLT